MNIDTSEYISKAKKIVEKIRGKKQTIEEIKNLSIELSLLFLSEAKRIQTKKEKKVEKKLAKLMKDPIGKAFTTAMTDECFRSKNLKRIADQIIYLLHQYGIPQYLSVFQRVSLFVFKLLGPSISRFFVPFSKIVLRKESSKVILPGEYTPLLKHIKKRKEENVRLNLNHLGEAILGEEEAKKRLAVYLEDLQRPEIDYVSIKISTIYSQINLLSRDNTIEKTADRLKILYRAAMKNTCEIEGKKQYKFVNLDMEEYRDLHLTIEIFQKVLEEEEFQNFPAGIVLQAYLPDALDLQKKLTTWAKKRISKGGAPIKIRIVKGANLANEQVEASLKGWSQAPYTKKMHVDANYKKMLLFGFSKENAKAVHIGVASHNLFDISFAILLRSERQVEEFISFEMLEGMADHIRRAVQEFTGKILLYCPVAKKKDFQHAIAYLIRRLDENTGQENFLRHLFNLQPGTKTFEELTQFFSKSCDLIEKLETSPRRKQNRKEPIQKNPFKQAFTNEPDTDFSLIENVKWAEEILKKYEKKSFDPIPIVIDGKEILENKKGQGINPSSPKKPFYQYMLAEKKYIEQTIQSAKAYEEKWKKVSIEKRCEIAANVTQIFREKRGELLGIMMLDGGKTFLESDPEISEAIDKCAYYYHEMLHLQQIKDVQCTPKGTVLVTPPWNFPCAIPTGGMISSLLTGNCVIFKPAPETVLVGWYIVNYLWEAGVPKQALQFLNCEDDPEGSLLIKDKRINTIILTGSTNTAKTFLKLRPSLDLSAETGGKNAMIITSMSDRDLAIKDLIHSAFSHSGQKCSATSLAILEAEVYDDPHFFTQLKDAVSSLKVGGANVLSTKIGPLIKPPSGALLQGLTTLEKKEKWLLQPQADPKNPHLWSPGVKYNVQLDSFTQTTELFGPVLGIIRAKNLSHAIELANSTKYGLTSGIHSLDRREQLLWSNTIQAGNCYINRTTTGAVIRRQPFGGCKASNFGNGYKAGGPNYLLETLHLKQKTLPKEKSPVNNEVNYLTTFLENIELSAEQLGLWYVSISNYTYWWGKMKIPRDSSKLVGQDNDFLYIPEEKITLRVSDPKNAFDILRVFAACLTCKCPLEVSWDKKQIDSFPYNWVDFKHSFSVIVEEEKQFLQRVKNGEIKRVRVLHTPSKELYQNASTCGCHICHAEVLANGRYELLHYLREVSISTDYHRYGNLGGRENELRNPIL